ncbi:MAG: Histidine kinase [Aeromicrobium sp.]|nr:Histidine kinase [Aeromicrobium sp.]
MTLFGSKLAVAKAVIGSVVVLDLITLGAFGIHSTTTTTTTVAVAAPPATAAPSVPSATPAPVTPDGSGVPLGATDLAANTQAIASGDTTTTTPPKDNTDPGTDTPPPDDFVAAKCPIALPEPAHDGGLQSLITLAPAFGPFKDEAFAAAAAYQPLLQLLGPILAQYPNLVPTVEPVLDPLLGAWEGLLDQGFALLGPYYAPYRQQVLKAESDLATALAPYSQALAASPLASCLVDLEAALVNDTKPATATS